MYERKEISGNNLKAPKKSKYRLKYKTNDKI